MRETPNPELAGWLENFAERSPGRLLEIGLLDSRSAANASPLMCPQCPQYRETSRQQRRLRM